MVHNDWLSTYFDEDVAEDLEKTAQALMLTKLAENAGLDLNQLSEEEIQALAAELTNSLGAQQNQMQAPGGLPGQGLLGGLAQGQIPGHVPQAPNHMQMQSPQASSPEMMAKEAQAKFEEADALGRVMAHAYTDELEKIAGIKDKAQAFGSAAKSHIARGGRATADYASRGGRAVSDHVSRNKGRYGAGAAAVGGFAAGRASKREKTASAFEKIANDRALEILQTLGVDPANGQEPDQTQDVDFGTAVDQRALQILADAGYDPNEVATAYDQTVAGGEVPQQ